MDIDWSKAPEGATHINQFAGRWIKHSGNGQYQFWNGAEWEMGFGCMDNRYTKRPEPDAWTGEGLPPVGTVCEALWNEGSGVWFKTTVFGVNEHNQPIHRWEEGPKKLEYQASPFASLFDGRSYFRPLRTPEQIAAEEREKAIEDMVALVVKGQDYSVQAEIGTSTADYVRNACKQLHDAGYRKRESN